MEPATHALVCLLLARTGLNGITRFATALLLASGLAADLDWLSYLAGPRPFLTFHNTLLHSFPGAAFLICILASIAYAADRLVKLKPNGIRFKLIPALCLCVIGAGTHVLLDICATSGVRLLWPFSSRWFAWDFAPTFDFWLVVLLFAGLLVPALFRLVTEEIGGHRKRMRIDGGAMVALMLATGYLGWRASMHSQAVKILLSPEYHGTVARSAGAFPSSASPLEWRGVVSTDRTYEIVDLSFAPRPRENSTFDPDAGTTLYKPEPSSPLSAGQKTTVAREFVAYAQFPFATLNQTENGWRLDISDLRYPLDRNSFGELVAIIDEDMDARVTRTELQFGPGNR